MEVLRAALAMGHSTLLVATNRHFFKNLKQLELQRRYPRESKKVKIVKPSELIKQCS